jgi:hypothetical protein
MGKMVLDGGIVVLPTKMLKSKIEILVHTTLYMYLYVCTYSMYM